MEVTLVWGRLCQVKSNFCNNPRVGLFFQGPGSFFNFQAPVGELLELVLPRYLYLIRLLESLDAIGDLGHG